MIVRTCVIACLCAYCFGCSQPGQADSPKSAGKPEPNQALQPDATKVPYTHTIAIETPYYTSGPQQGRPPDGTFTAGTKVTLVKESGSYSLVKSENDTEAHVATNVLRPINTTTKVTTKATAEDMGTVVAGNTQFAVDLYAQLSGDEGNLFFSPHSISTALAMTYAGAEGKTAQEMATVLQFDLSGDRLHPAFASLTNKLNAPDKPYELSVANRLWGQQGYEFLPAFLQTTRENYGAELAQVDFVRAAESARKEINTWVEQQTNDKIKDLIPEGVLNELTRLVLTNAIYFHGKWETQFSKDATRNAPFSVTMDNKVEIPLMYQKGSFKYADAKDLQVLELPYKGEELSMVVLLPKPIDGLPALEAQLSADNLKAWTSAARKQKVNVFLPRFKMTSEFQLNDVLASMGMPSAFDPQGADFSGMNGKTDLFISAVIHKAYVDVNEEGTEAAAATGIAIGVTSVEITPTFRADHPFLFLIRDNRTGSLLFLGRVVNPQA